MSNFRDWTSTKLEKRFGLKRRLESDVLTQWLDMPFDLSDFELASLKHLQQLLNKNADAWNEQELSLHFIGPIFSLVDFTEFGKFNLFAARPLSAIVDKEELTGIPDGIIASGWLEPEVPYFCFHEYKKEIDPSGDPISQCLAAMLVAQELNHNDKPIYGCVVIGRNWRFIVLEQLTYAISDVFVATQADIKDIYRILKTLRQYVANEIGLRIT
jgi:hypothetical protein